MKRATVAAVATALALPALAVVTSSSTATASPAPAVERGRPEVSTGKVIRQGNGEPLRGVLVVVLGPGYQNELGRDRTDRNGRWRVGGLEGLDDSEISIEFYGPRGWEDGAYSVDPATELQEVQRFCNEASASAGDIGKIRIQRDTRRPEPCRT